MAATSWNGWGMARGSCTVHIWNDSAEGDEADPKAGTRVNERLEHEESLYSAPRQTGQTGAGARSFVDEDYDDG